VTSSVLCPAVRPARPLVYGHRGCALAPENTLAAFDRAIEGGADGLELDVRLSRDGVLMVHHDAELDRCTSGSGPLERLTAAELTAIDAGHQYRRGGEFPFRGRGVSIPRLTEVLGRYPGVPLIVEIKSYSEAAGRAAVHAIRSAGAEGRVCVAAFDHSTLSAVRHTAPEIATSASRDEVLRALWRSWFCLAPSAPPYRAVQVPERAGRRRVVSKRFVRVLHKADVPIQVWTVNAEEDMRRLLEWGVDGLITDDPPLAAKVRDDVCANVAAVP
jgi:glycerophosphoryl diester phosphodiesterase